MTIGASGRAIAEWTLQLEPSWQRLPASGSDPSEPIRFEWYPAGAEAGTAVMMLAVMLVGLEPGDDAASYEALLSEPSDDEVLSVEAWSGILPAGPYAASREVADVPDDDERIQGSLQEHVSVVVFPHGASQLVALEFLTRGVLISEDVSARALAIVDTLAVALDPAPADESGATR